jgi:hypothetical protein
MASSSPTDGGLFVSAIFVLLFLGIIILGVLVKIIFIKVNAAFDVPLGFIQLEIDGRPGPRREAIPRAGQ